MKFLTAEVKTISDAGPGAFEAIASTETIDRDGEIVAKGAFLPLPDSVPIHVDHRMSSEGLVGTGQPYYSGDRLMVRGTFAGTARAQEVRQLVKEGHLNRMSVGFMGAARSKSADGTPLITRATLLEISLVSVPSNPEALVLAAKAHSGDMTLADARRFIAKTMAEMAVVDAMSALQADDRLVESRSRPRAVLADAQALLADLAGSGH